MAIDKLKYVADFETNTMECDNMVWGTALYDIEMQDIEYITNNIDDFMFHILQRSKKFKQEIYFHNLKFDGKFILAWLYKNDYCYDDTLCRGKTFRTVITDMGIWYQIEIRGFTKTKCKVITFRDSTKIIPLPVEKIPKAFGLEVLKGSIDYDIYRPVNHQITKEEREYIIHDVEIVGKALKHMFDLGLTKMTIASNAIHHYKNMLGGSLKFRDYFPELPFTHKSEHYENPDGVITTDDYIRRAYKGGYTFCNPRIAGKLLNQNGMTYDVNSLYPSQMYTQLLPVDMPIFYEGRYQENKNYPLYIQRIKCHFKLKKGYAPIIQIKGNSRFVETEYLKDSGYERVELIVTSVDLDLIKKHYDLSNVLYIDGYMFKGEYGLFKDYIDYWIKIKIEADKAGNAGLKSIAKLMLNSLYGKFAVNPKSFTKASYLDENNIVREQLKSIIQDNDLFEGTLKEDKELKMNYTAMACFITAYARKVTIEAIQSVGGLNKNSRFCYADTDSIHILGTEIPTEIKIHENELGAWKHECCWTTAKFIRAKTYLEVVNGELDVKCAGMPDQCKKLVTLKNFKIGFSILADDETIDKKYKKLMPKSVVGGCILAPTDFTIK